MTRNTFLRQSTHATNEMAKMHDELLRLGFTWDGMDGYTKDLEQEKAMHNVFVYGTLKRGHGNNGLLVDYNAVFVGEAVTVQPYLMLYAGIPYVVEYLPYGSIEPHPVQGEVYQVSDECLSRLDSLEGYSPQRPEENCHYVRKEIRVAVHPQDTPEQAREWQAFIYFGNPHIAASRCLNNPVLPKDGVLVYPGYHWEDEDDDGDRDDDEEVIEPEDQDQGDVLGLDDEREQS